MSAPPKKPSTPPKEPPKAPPYTGDLDKFEVGKFVELVTPEGLICGRLVAFDPVKAELVIRWNCVQVGKVSGRVDEVFITREEHIPMERILRHTVLG